MKVDGTCPTCGNVLAPAPVPGRGDPDEQPFTPAAGEEVATKVPWHFWLLVVAVVVYLTWRIIQMIGWLFD